MFETGDSEGIDRYSEKALARVWKAERFSWWMTNLLHRFPDQNAFDLKMQRQRSSFCDRTGRHRRFWHKIMWGCPIDEHRPARSLSAAAADPRSCAGFLTAFLKDLNYV